MSPRLVLASALGAVCLAACGGSETGYGPGNQFIDSDCDPGLDICDVNDADCQEHIWEATACQRSQKRGDLPTIRSITRAEFGAELTQDVMPGGPPTAWDVTMGLLGLLDSGSEPGGDTIATLVDGVLGFYDTRTGVVTLLSDATDIDDKGKVLVLSHEFVHVLQDRSRGFDLLEDRHGPNMVLTSDLVIANDALTEGEAVVHSNIAIAAGDGTAADELGWDAYFDGMYAGIFGAIDGSGSPFVDALLQLPYPLGGRPVLDAWFADGQRGINALYTDERMYSVADWARPYPEGIDSPRPQLDCPLPAAPEDYTAVGQDVFGVAALTALWSAHDESAATGFERGRQWRGGATWVYGKGDEPRENPERSLLLWQTRWASADDAEAVASLLEDTDLLVRTDGVQAVIVATDDPAAASWAEDQASDWLACDDTKRKRLPEAPLAPYRQPDPRHYVTRSHLAALH